LVLITWFPIGHRWLLQKAAELWVWLRITLLAASCSLRNSCDFSDGNWSCCENEDLSKFCVDRYAARRSRPHSSWIGCGWKWMNMGGSLELVVLRGGRSTLNFFQVYHIPYTLILEQTHVEMVQDRMREVPSCQTQHRQEESILPMVRRVWFAVLNCRPHNWPSGKLT
jgi:hypothetical protein